MSAHPRSARRARWLAPVVGPIVVLAGAVSCADPPSSDDLVEALERSGLPAEQARCAADAIYEHLDDDQIAEIAERGPSGAPRDDPERTDDPMDLVREDMSKCRVLGPTTTTTTTTAPSSTDASGGPAPASGSQPASTSAPGSTPTSSTAPGGR